MKRILSRISLLVSTLFLLAYLLTTMQQRNLFNANLNDILPQDRQISTAALLAEKANDQMINQKILLMIGNKDAQIAEAEATKISALWQKNNGLEVVLHHFPNLQSLASMVAPLRLALLPYQQYQLLMQAPSQYFNQLAKDISNPFSAPSIISLNNDHLGLSRFILAKLKNNSQLSWQENTGLLTTTQEGWHWVAITVTLQESQLINQKMDFLQLLDNSHQLLQKDSQLLATGGALFAKSSQITAEKDSKLLGGASIALILIFLILIFRQIRIIFVMIPITVGFIFGIAATIFFFGQVHLLTLVIATSIVGILVDFPLHWLSASLIEEDWQANASLKKMRKLFFLGAFITGMGYLLLIFAPLSILQQTAIFSFFALIGALWATLSLLPMIFKARQAPIKTYQNFSLKALSLVLSCKKYLLKYRYMAGLLMILLLAGIAKTQWTDNIRSWVNLNPSLLRQSIAISEISAYAPSSQFILVNAKNDDELWSKVQQVSQALAPLKGSSFDHETALTQWSLSPEQQQSLQKKLHELQSQPETWQALSDLNIPDDFVIKGIEDIQKLAIIDYPQALQLPIAQQYQNIYLGETTQGQFSSIIRFDHLRNTQAIADVAAKFSGVYFIDRVQRINQLFEQTRLQAILFKLLSFAIAAILLMSFLGAKKGISIIAVPLFSSLLTLSILGCLNITIGVFPIFSLLLVSAIGIDFALFTALKPQNQQAATLLGIILSLVTTLISFGLLTMSDTPVIRDFGLTIVIGITCNAILACLLFKNPSTTEKDNG